MLNIANAFADPNLFAARSACVGRRATLARPRARVHPAPRATPSRGSRDRLLSILRATIRCVALRLPIAVKVRRNQRVQFLPLIVLVLSSPLVFCQMLAVDDLILLEHDHHRLQWEYDGRPRTMLRAKLRFSSGWSLRSALATQRCHRQFHFVTPAWARADREATRLIRRLRILTACWFFLALPLFVLSALVSASFK